MAIRQIRLPDPSGAPRLVVPETSTIAPPSAPAPTPVRTPMPAPVPAPVPASTPIPAPDAEPLPAAAVRAQSGPVRQWYRAESWLVVELAAVVPIVAAIVAPEAVRLPLVALGGVLVVLGLALLAVHERDARRAAGGVR